MAKGWARRPAAGPLRFARGHQDCRLAIPPQVGIDLPQHLQILNCQIVPIFPNCLRIYLKKKKTMKPMQIPITHCKHHFPHILRFSQEEALPDFLAPHAVAPRPPELSRLAVSVRAAKKVVPAMDQLLHRFIHVPTISLELPFLEIYSKPCLLY